MGTRSWSGWGGILVVALAFLLAQDGDHVAQAQGGAALRGTTMRVSTWGGSWKDARHVTAGKRLEQLGVKVEYVVGNPMDNFAKLVAARGRDVPFDLMELGTGDIKIQAREQGFLEKLDLARVPNARDLPPASVDVDAASTHLMQIVIAYNAEKFKEQGLPAPTEFKQLFHPKLAGRVAFPDINTTMAAYTIVGFAMLAGGDEHNIAPGFKKIGELKVNYYYKASTDLITKFTMGDVWAAPWHVGWVFRARKAGFPMSFADPRGDKWTGMIANEWVGIIKGSRNRAAAEAYLNAMLDPDLQVDFAKRVFMAPTTRKALQKVAADAALRESFMWREEEIKKAYELDWKVLARDWPKWVEAWNRVTLR
ncbi:MAG: extracellular solute-binding protein [Deltaproteobacteria bacterium]|nr:extracellular solute-binding protein [Deltaproteobacteria bacterium]